MAKPLPTAESLREMLDYDPESGAFTWRVARRGYPAGAIAGRTMNKGYRQITIFGNLYLAHRLAWLHVYGCWPADQIDHINGVKDDNCLANLRECTAAENQQNVNKRKDNTSGFVGVTWHAKNNNWRASINLKGRRHNLGSFKTAAEASAAYAIGKAQLHEFQPSLRETV